MQEPGSILERHLQYIQSTPFQPSETAPWNFEVTKITYDDRDEYVNYVDFDYRGPLNGYALVGKDGMITWEGFRGRVHIISCDPVAGSTYYESTSRPANPHVVIAHQVQVVYKMRASVLTDTRLQPGGAGTRLEPGVYTRAHFLGDYSTNRAQTTSEMLQIDQRIQIEANARVSMFLDSLLGRV